MTWRWVGDRALLRRFPGEVIDANPLARALAISVGELALAEVEDVVAGATTVLVTLRGGSEPSARLQRALEGTPRPVPDDGRLHTFDVTYDGEDIDDVARAHNLSRAEVASLHAEPVYVVAFLGFAPGFPYLIGLPRALVTPRLATPRAKVPAGSVAIGGEFTGIYPRATPGGWRLIGRTEGDLFDPERDPPALLSPGDRIRFRDR